MIDKNIQFRSKIGMIFYGHDYIGSLGCPYSDVDNTRLDGESWLSMRDRTKPLREDAEYRSCKIAREVAEFLNEKYKDGYEKELKE